MIDLKAKMLESHSSPHLGPSQRSSSIRWRKRRDEVKQQFVKNRRSGDFGYRVTSDAVDDADDVVNNCKVDTLDHGPTADGLQHNLRPLLRNKYIQSPLSDTEEYLESDKMGSVWRTRRRGGVGRHGVKIKHFGMIDQPEQAEIKSSLSEQHDKR